VPVIRTPAPSFGPAYPGGLAYAGQFTGRQSGHMPRPCVGANRPRATLIAYGSDGARRRRDEGVRDVSGEEPVTSPDQHKPGPYKAARIAAVAVIIALLLMIFGNQKGHVETLWLIGIALVLLLILIYDWAVRRNGIKQ